jgi:predicted Rossmann-fold nucleotide-binding protein
VTLDGQTVLVCGGRRYSDHVTLGRVLADIHAEKPIGVIVIGAATGADALAWAWAEKHGIQYAAFRADWDTFGKAAGPRRNRQMLDTTKPDLVVAFPGGRGTAHMVSIARAAGVKVIEVPT